MPNIMLIDDDEASHLYHTLMIEEAGLDKTRVFCFYNVDDSIQHLRKLGTEKNKNYWPDYIFIDINMPQKSGFDFVKEYRVLNFDLHQPIMYFVSTSKNPKDHEKANNLQEVSGLKEKFLQKEFFEDLDCAF